ncbi:MAG: fasciclin domain-containing protein [Armatimonadota bacterium]|nr:fasciclin domain-containing protein [Armatimonadota bacterium]
MEAQKVQSITDTVARSESLRTLWTAVHESGLEDTLRGVGPFTIFAPADEAFAKLPASTLRRLLKNKKTLSSVLEYHVIPGRVSAAEAAGLVSARTVQGQPLMLAEENGRVMVDHARVLQADIPCANGFIHVIDHVVSPKA